MQTPSLASQMLTALALLVLVLEMTAAMPFVTADPDPIGSAEGGSSSAQLAVDLALIAPSRPNIFRNPEELRTYLEALSNYYAIAGRPRFGKRNGPVKLNKRPISWVMSADDEDTSALLDRLRPAHY